MRTRLLPLALLGLAPLAVRAQTVYANTFTAGAGSEWSNPATSTANGERFLATSANGSGVGTNTLSLSALPGHNTLQITFDLYILQTWDGNGPNGGNSPTNPDAIGVALDGTARFLASFANYTGGNTQSYPSQLAPLGSGASNAPRTGQFEANHLGYGAEDLGDATYRITLTVPHTGSTAAFAFTSLQNQVIGDEGWGLDNVSVVASGAPVPEPASLAALGLGVLAIARRRRQAQA